MKPHVVTCAVGVRELKARLSEYVRRARDGEVVLVTDRGRVVAELRAHATHRASTETGGIDRLVEKGYVKWKRLGNVYEYSPRVRRKTAVARVVDDVVDRVLEGAAAPFIQRLVQRGRLTRDEAQELRQMLDDYTQGEAPPHDGRPAEEDDDRGPLGNEP